MNEIIDMLGTIVGYFGQMIQNFHHFLQIVGHSLNSAIDIVGNTQLYPNFLTTVITLTLGVYVVKAVLSLGSHHE